MFGKVVEVKGPVVDVIFDEELPKINEALTIDISADNVASFKNQRTVVVITNKWLEYIKTVLERKLSQ